MSGIRLISKPIKYMCKNAIKQINKQTIVSSRFSKLVYMCINETPLVIRMNLFKEGKEVTIKIYLYLILVLKRLGLFRNTFN